MKNQEKQDPVRAAAVAWAEVEYRNAESFSRSDLALTVNAYRAAHFAALEAVRAEMERRYAQCGGSHLKGSYEAGEQSAYGEAECWVENLMEKYHG